MNKEQTQLYLRGAANANVEGTPDYVRLTRVNNWEHITYRHKDEELRFSEGQALRVRWPDASETVETVAMKKETRYYYDHGHQSSVRNNLPTFHVLYRGMGITIDDLSKVEVARQDLVEAGR